ncbi:hypothetical protein OFM35_33330, partial [Escherichia coli]|nr:hypothetical protein [Escherichia coli]
DVVEVLAVRRQDSVTWECGADSQTLTNFRSDHPTPPVHQTTLVEATLPTAHQCQDWCALPPF